MMNVTYQHHQFAYKKVWLVFNQKNPFPSMFRPKDRKMNCLKAVKN